MIAAASRGRRAAMEPGLRDREYRHLQEHQEHQEQAAMEPGLRDREYQHAALCGLLAADVLQWSPVLETGNTHRGHLYVAG